MTTGIRLAFTGVGPLHKNFFSQPGPLAALTSALGPCIDGEATVRVTWEEAIRLGHVTLEVAPTALRCAPVMRGDGLDLSALEPVGRALAAYRDAVAGAYDLRVASFRGEVRLVRPGDDCLLRIGGDFPPDGSRWHACAQVGDRSVCAPDDDGDGVTVLRPPSPQPALAACAAP